MKKKIFVFTILFNFLISFSQTIDVTEIELNFSQGSNPRNITKGATKIYFTANDGVHGEELWVHENITNVTHLVKDISSAFFGFTSQEFAVIGDILYFSPVSSTFGTELWRSDGTETGTYLVKNINTATSNTLSNLTVFNGKIYFSADDSINGNEIWVSDGTTSGTTILKDIFTGSGSSDPTNLYIFNGSLFFSASTISYGRELWKSDGTTVGTNLLIDINSASSDGLMTNNTFLSLNNEFYFYADNGSNGFELWKSNGTASGTQLFKDITAGSLSSNYNLTGAATNNYFIFEVNSSSLGKELWKSDGTVIGTVLLKDIAPGNVSSVSEFTKFEIMNNKIYFSAYTISLGYEIWETDGTTAGTQLLKDINPGNSSSNIENLTATPNFLLFTALDNTQNYRTLWKSDGTGLNTVELKDVNMNYSNSGKFTEVNGKLFFAAGYESLNGTELWSTDGTLANTLLFKDIAHKFDGMTDFYDSAELGNKLIFNGNNGLGKEPFITDGTVVGTHLIKDIFPGEGSAIFSSDGFRPACYTKAGNNVYFKAYSAGNGVELWKTDGTEANTSMVKDINVGTGNSITEYPLFMSFNNIFYFKANDGIHGEELWRSDGTDIGTYMLKDINPGSAHAFDGQSNVYYNSYSALNENCFAILNGYLYFAANDGYDNSIWRTDGTQSGTVKIIIIPSSGIYDNRRVVINASDTKIFFKTNTSNTSYGNNSLWSSDGTQGGTTLVHQNIIQGPVQFKKNIIHNNTLYFTSFNNTGMALMKSDGSISGTQIVKGGLTSQDTFNTLKSCGNFVYFGLGNQGLSASKELWRTDGTNVGTIKIGDISTSSIEYFYDCKACYQNNLIFKKLSLNDDKIYYVNGSSTNTNSYLTTNILNSDNFGTNGYYFFSDFYAVNGKLLFAAEKESSGYELYSSEFTLTLATPDLDLNSKSNIVVYPNPAKNHVNLSISNEESILKVLVYDMLSKEIALPQLSPNELDISDINNGIYILKIITSKSQYTAKLIVKK